MEDKLPEQEPIDTTTEDASPEEVDGPETPPRPAFVINFYSWATPIIGVLMLLVGLAAGYFGRPLLEVRLAPTATPTAAVSQEQDANAAALMAQVVANTHHFKGSPNAPVTIVEFSDYQ
jgi:hypothetical protein